jgi:SepF-like predicted cell division protein (DUF552 family)
MEQGKRDNVQWIGMPSAGEAEGVEIIEDAMFHDLAELYPDAPVPGSAGSMVIHRAVLHDTSGMSELFDWVAQGDLVIVELRRLMERKIEFADAVSRLQSLIEGDLGGQLVQIGDERLLLLPSSMRGMRGVVDEVFSPPHD